MAKGLNILTHAAQPKGYDRRKLPRCANPDCRRKAMHLGRGKAAKHCYQHGTDQERAAYLAAWRNPEHAE